MYRKCIDAINISARRRKLFGLLRKPRHYRGQLTANMRFRNHRLLHPNSSKARTSHICDTLVAIFSSFKFNNLGLLVSLTGVRSGWIRLGKNSSAFELKLDRCTKPRFSLRTQLTAI